jgi:hypothetical protein
MYRARAKYGQEWTIRFCVGMLTFYHMGTAAKAADHEGFHFWDYLYDVYETAPRAAERRHFRGKPGLIALTDMKKFSPEPENFFDTFPRTYMGISRHCDKYLSQFGPYFQLKICDYMDRCLGMTIKDMIGLQNNLPTLPYKAASLLHPDLSTPNSFLAACRRVSKLEILAPPAFDRPIGPAEVETILCDWKRAKNGTSWIGADVLDKRRALKDSGDKAAWMSDCLPKTVLKDTFILELE